jgi:hypothetical protein
VVTQDFSWVKPRLPSLFTTWYWALLLNVMLAVVPIGQFLQGAGVSPKVMLDTPYSSVVQFLALQVLPKVS